MTASATPLAVSVSPGETEELPRDVRCQGNGANVGDQQRSHVPKFGNWEGEENVPYTAYFDKARKGKTGGKMINPNDPQDNPGILSDNAPPVQVPPFRTGAEPDAPMGQEAIGPKHERRSSREDGDLRRATDLGRKAATDLPHQRHGPTHGDRGGSSGGPTRRVARPSTGSDRSIEQSPLHPQHQAKIAGSGSGVSSPSWERKGPSEGSHGLAPSTPGRSRLGARGDETADQGPAVPKFGDWDENNPSAADGYTHIFNQVREERQTGTAKVPIMANGSSYFYGQKQNSNDNSKVMDLRLLSMEQKMMSLCLGMNIRCVGPVNSSESLHRVTP
ncbi:hypothetical protein HHK36_027117 [Tetracentron sinense]|uniref:RIN4 pathogenic type III effector avirulence factor Avr cleavage site domain-containing protein n=1 Tax=Tetracentron sinense TaxID=13715 RepID=A0A834YI11_TETSI|nr:hypothetical protein HHK36_027117 [Tetracentron sinense]